MELIENYIPEMTGWFETAIQYIDQAGPRTSPHVLRHHFSRPQMGVTQAEDSFSGFTVTACVTPYEPSRPLRAISSSCESSRLLTSPSYELSRLLSSQLVEPYPFTKGLGESALACSDTASLDASIAKVPMKIGEVAPGIVTEQTPSKHAVPTEGDNNMLDITANTEASIVEHSECLP